MSSVLTHSAQVARFVLTHPANRGRRGRQLTRAVLFQLRGRLGFSTRTRIGERSWMQVELHAASGSKVVYANPPDFNEMIAWRRILRPGDLFVDVGANVGSYSLWAAECGTDVIAIEPHPQTAARLRRNVALNPYPIQVRQVALADRPGRLWLTSGLDSENHLLVGPDGPAGPDRAGRQSDGPDRAGRQSDGPDRAGRQSDPAGIEVAVQTLDDLVESRHPVFVKIDVEGAEELVLRGATRALTDERILAIQLEWNSASADLLGRGRDVVAELLTGHGFRLFRPSARGDLVWCPHPDVGPDVFAVRPEVLTRLGIGVSGARQPVPAPSGE